MLNIKHDIALLNSRLIKHQLGSVNKDIAYQYRLEKLNESLIEFNKSQATGKQALLQSSTKLKLQSLLSSLSGPRGLSHATLAGADIVKYSMFLFKRGTHLGHKSYKLSRSRPCHPSMSKFIIGSRDSIKILNNEMSIILLVRALYIIALVARMKGSVLIINTHPDFLKLISNTVSGFSWAFLANSKWVGGTLTNWKQISKSIITFARFSNQYDRFLVENNITYPRYNKMKTCFKGFIGNNISARTQKKLAQTRSSSLRKDMSSQCLVREADQQNNEINCLLTKKIKKPALIFIANPNDNRNVIQEAKKLHIPVIALTNSDSNLFGITYPIPVNGCSLNVLHLCLDWIHRVTKDDNIVQ